MSIIHLDDSIDPLRVTYTREWQLPTYLLLKEDVSLMEYTCDSAQTECKINLKITPLLDGASSSILTCEIASDFEIVPTSDPCNPNTSIVPVGNHDLTIKILDKNKNTILQTSTLTLRNIPEDNTIDPTKVVTDIIWQQPTYLLEKNDTTKTFYTCDAEKTECKVNLLVVPKLEGVESPKLSCHIATDFGFEENDCNPAELIIPKGNHTLTINTKNTATGDIISTRIIQIQWLPELIGGGGSFSVLDLTQAQIVIQSGLESDFVCKTETCQVNFLADIPAGVICNWDFWSGIFETADTDKKCNPGYVKFATDTSVKLTITDPNNSSNTLTKSIPIYRTKFSDVEKPLDWITAHISLQTKITSNKKLMSNGISCALWKAEKCSLNFTGTDSIGAKKWYWDFWDGTISEKENPWSHSFWFGTYHVRLTVSDGDKSHTALYEVVVVRDFGKVDCLDCENMRGKIQISAVLANPPHADTVEWIEITNISSENVSLDGCTIADETTDFDISGILDSGRILRLKQSTTGLNLWNSHESLKLMCGDALIDTFSWDFEIPTGYILRRKVLDATPEQAVIQRVIDGDTLDAVIGWVLTRVRLLGIDTPETVHPRKPVEKFGKEASEYTRKTLEGKTVWLTFDAEPVDHYGRRLAYVWQCDGLFSQTSCILFNAEVVTKWYGRMERRFEFRRYEEFDISEKEAKKAKLGIWSDHEVSRVMNELSADEKTIFLNEQEKEYLELQEELLAECLEAENEWCEEKKPKWSEVTEKISTLNATSKKSVMIAIFGRTWWKFPIKIEVYQNDIVIETLETISDEIGEYEIFWLPKSVGNYGIKILLQKDSDMVQKEKEITIDAVSPHFTSPLMADILLQGQITNNRWREGDIFHCRSREYCSVNVIAENNREDEVSYLWIFPDGSVSDEKNPWALKLQFGQHEILLITIDEITGEAVSSSLAIDHQPIPKKSRTSSKNSKYTLDLKDVPQDIGGGVVLQDGENPIKQLWINILLLFTLSGIVFLSMKYSR